MKNYTYIGKSIKDMEKSDYMEETKYISINELEDFKNHPYKVTEDEKLQELVESIKINGVLSPIIVRKKEDKYEIISGHRRKKACMLANIKEIPCIVKDLNDNEATILMVDSNIQREEVLPSEKAFAYKMKLDAQKHQGVRKNITSVRDEQKLKITTRDKIALEVGESSSNIRRYIRLTNLVKELLDLVDNKKIALSPAVELSYLSEKEQKRIYQNIEFLDITPSYSQTIRMKKLSQLNKLTFEKIDDIMLEEKPNQVEKIKLNSARLKKVLPKNISSEKQIEDYIIKCIESVKKNKRLDLENER